MLASHEVWALPAGSNDAVGVRRAEGTGVVLVITGLRSRHDVALGIGELHARHVVGPTALVAHVVGVAGR